MKYLKINRSLSLMFFACLMLSVFSCTNDDEFELLDGTKGDFTTFGVNFNEGGTAVVANGLTNDIAGDDVGNWDLCCIDDQFSMYSLFTSGDAFSSIERSITHSSGASGSLSAISSVPADGVQLQLTMLEALAATGLTADDVDINESFTIQHWLNGKAQGGADIKVELFSSLVVYKSALAGELTGKATVTAQGGAAATWDGAAGAVWEGPVTFVRQQANAEDDGEYIIMTKNGAADPLEDISFGAYYSGYGTDAQGSLPNGDLRLRDIDNKLSITGASQWGEVYSIENVVVDGATLSFKWTNDYGEGAEIVLTRDDGEDWPPLN